MSTKKTVFRQFYNCPVSLRWENKWVEWWVWVVEECNTHKCQKADKMVSIYLCLNPFIIHWLYIFLDSYIVNLRWYAKRFLHPDIVARYDYIFIWDEDLGVDHFNAEEWVSFTLIFIFHDLNQFLLTMFVVADTYTWWRSMALRFRSLVWIQREDSHGRLLKEENIVKSIISIYMTHNLLSRWFLLHYKMLYKWLESYQGNRWETRLVL